MGLRVAPESCKILFTRMMGRVCWYRVGVCLCFPFLPLLHTSREDRKENGYRSFTPKDPHSPFPLPHPMLLSRSHQGSVSLLNDSSGSTARSFDSPSSGQMSSSRPNNPPPPPQQQQQLLKYQMSLPS